MCEVPLIGCCSLSFFFVFVDEPGSLHLIERQIVMLVKVLHSIFHRSAGFVSGTELLFKVCDHCDLCWSKYLIVSCIDPQDFVSGAELLFQVCGLPR